MQYDFNTAINAGVNGRCACPNTSRGVLGQQQSQGIVSTVRIAATSDRSKVSQPYSGVDASRWLIRSGIVVALACVIAGVVLIVTGPQRSTAGVTRGVVPGMWEIVLSDSGRHILYYEHRSTVDNQRYNTPSWLPPVEISIQDASTGSLIRLEPPNDDPYDYTRYAGIPVLQFEASNPGRFIINVVDRSERRKPFVMAVSNGSIRNPQRDTLPGFASIALGIVIAFRVLLSRLGL